jgi:hypothetical protein
MYCTVKCYLILVGIVSDNAMMSTHDIRVV